MLSTITALLILSLSLIGVGRLIEILLWSNTSRSPLHTIQERGLLGIIGLSAVGMIMHFIVPLRDYPLILIHSIGLLVVGVWGFSQRRTKLSQSALVLAVLFITFLIYLAFASYGPTPTYDTGLYHLQATLWNREAALSPGLALLHDRFGFNSIWFILSASLGLPKIWNSSLLLPNVLLFLFAIGSLVEYVRASYSRKVPKHRFALAITTLAFSWGFPQILNEFNSISTDFPTMVLTVYIVFLLFYHKPTIRMDSFIFLLGVTLVLIKLSAAVFFIGLVILLLLRNRAQLVEFAQSQWRVLFLILVLVATWLVRGYLQSGCLLFPLSLSCLELHTWSTSANQAIITQSWVESWAKWPGQSYKEVLGSLAWIQGWWLENALSSSIFARIFQAIAALMVLIFGYKFKIISKKDFALNTQTLSGVLLILSASLVYWFFSAPAPRFIAGVFVSIAIIPVTLLVTATIAEAARRIPFRSVAILLFVFLIFETLQLSASYRQRTAYPLWQRIPQSFQLQNTTRSGQTIYGPVSGDQCWGIELPCTPYFNENLTFRWEGNRVVFGIEE